METTKVTCAACGFLSTCDNNLHSIEVVSAMRTTGHIPANVTASAGNRLICSMGKRTFGPVINNPIDGEAKRLLEEEHICLAYTPYIVGFSPKEHMALSFIEEWRNKLQKEAEYSRQQEDARTLAEREWREKQDAARDEKERQFQKELAAQAEEFQREMAAQAHKVQEKLSSIENKNEWGRSLLTNFVTAAIPLIGISGGVIYLAVTLFKMWSYTSGAPVTKP